MGDREWTEYTNSRGHEVTCCDGEHVSLSELKEDPDLENRYLKRKGIPYFPESVVFYASNVSHVTGESGLRGIFNDGGFRMPHCGHNENFMWWSLGVTDDEIAEAEDNFLEEMFSYYVDPNQQAFLKDFTTSPAFQRGSRYGNFRFTFSFKELLYRYARQFCYKSAPVLRVMDTRIYKQEIVYSVLVHPRHIKDYNQYPRLPRRDEDVCGYYQGQLSWRCQAPSGTHRHRLIVDEQRSRVKVKPLRREEYYVWDHVAVAFHMEPHWILRVNRAQLYNRITVCQVSQRNLLRDPDTGLGVDEAEEILEDLGREHDLV